MFHDLLCVGKMTVEVICDRQPNPILTHIGSDHKKGVSCFHQGIKHPKLCLELSCIPEDVNIFLRQVNI
jgi:hypothetical protein